MADIDLTPAFPAELPTLTIWQPWASLIMKRAKPYEFRGWPAPKAFHGRIIAIHAGARTLRRGELLDLIGRLRQPDAWRETGLERELALPLIEQALADPARLPLASILGTTRFGTPVKAVELFGDAADRDSDRIDHQVWAWPLSEITPLAPIAPARGRQGFWTWKRPA